MIIDFHTHIFPPHVRDHRDEYVARDPTFAEMYANPNATVATVEPLLDNMNHANVDISVALGFAWRGHGDIVRHNDYLLEAAASSHDHIIPFTTINMADDRAEAEIARCADAGARGLGELRPENQGWDLNGSAGDRLAADAREHDLILLFHVTEEGGHQYPGKQGCSLSSFRDFARKHPDLKIVGAHLGGDIYRTPDPPNVYVDTSAMTLLYRSAGSAWANEMISAFSAVPADRLLVGSDYPLRDVGEAAAPVCATFTRDEARLHAFLRFNAASLLGLPQEP